jgi:AcrR family transcriptional regulator
MSSEHDLPARERILTVAHDLFYRDGIRATGIDKVIEQANVAKATFYRHYPSKTDLIRAYLEYRHANWMAWLRATLVQHLDAGCSPIDALLATFDSWWQSPDYRGCAFINAAVELGGTDHDVLELVKEHKAEMAEVFETLLPQGPGRKVRSQALALAVDGAITQAQMGIPVPTVIGMLGLLVEPLLGSRK